MRVRLNRMHATRKEEHRHEVQPILVDKKVAARLLGVCSRTIDYLIGSGVLKPKRIGRRVLLHYEDLRQFAKDNR
jgi:excisionase family DNA binding protein